MSPRIILSVGENLTLLETRNMVLRAAGYIVESARSLKQAIDHCLARDFDIVIMCHSVSSKDRAPDLLDSCLWGAYSCGFCSGKSRSK